VSADLGLVVDAAEAHPHELAAHRAGDAPAKARLADAGRSDECEDRAADGVRQGAHREVLEDALLDFLQAVMVLVEDLRGGLDVELVVRADVPGQANQPVDVGPDHADFRRGRGDPAHPVDLLDRPGLDLLRHAGRLDLLAKLVDLGLLRVLLTKLALDRLQLLTQDVLALGLVHLGLDLGLDLALQLEDLDLAREEVADQLQALDDVDRLEQLLALLRGHVRAVGDHVRQQPRLGDVSGCNRCFGRDGCAVCHVLLDLRLDGAHERLDLDARRRPIPDLLDTSEDVRAGLGEAVYPESALALHNRPDGAVLKLDDLGDLGQGADRVELGGVVDVLLLSVSLSHEGNGSALRDGRVERVDALVATHLEGDDHLGKDDRLPESHERQLAHAGRRRGLRLLWVGRSSNHDLLLAVVGGAATGAVSMNRRDRMSAGVRAGARDMDCRCDGHAP